MRSEGFLADMSECPPEAKLGYRQPEGTGTSDVAISLEPCPCRIEHGRQQYYEIFQRQGTRQEA
jgi:hypothetical protein